MNTKVRKSPKKKNKCKTIKKILKKNKDRMMRKNKKKRTSTQDKNKLTNLKVISVNRKDRMNNNKTTTIINKLMNNKEKAKSKKRVNKVFLNLMMTKKMIKMLTSALLT